MIQKVEHSNWATPIQMENAFVVTINPNVISEHYPLPNNEDMYASLNGGKVFNKMDLTHTYQQLEINKASKRYLYA